MKMQNMKRGETTEQITLFQWAERSVHVIPELALMYHVPNEGKRTNGGVLRAAGLKSGVPDICLPVPSGDFHGLYIELKYGQNRPTKAQEDYMSLLRQQGNDVAVCYGCREAQIKILEYLQGRYKGRLALQNCISAPWIGGMCDGVQLPGRMFSKAACRDCEKHTPTKAERVIRENMAAVPDNFTRPMIKTVADLSAGKPLQNMSLEDTLETINKNLALLVRADSLTVEKSAEVLTVAMDAYKAGKGGKNE